MTSRGLTARSRGIFQIQRRDQRFFVCWDWLFVLFQAGDVPANGIFRHFFGFAQRAAIGHASWECRHDRGKSTFRFRAENDGIAIVSSSHLLRILFVQRSSVKVTQAATRYAVLILLCQCVQTNHTSPPTSTARITASNLWRYLPSSRQFCPSFMPNHASAKHHGHDPRNVYT